ncbi:MAG: hypothetical protein H7X77_04010 [Anaerolineae bacterium]|nr:hypothetical protein [Anaerolineae bacterium]
MISSCNIINGIFIEQTWLVPGDASSFDPVASYEVVRNHAGNDTQLVSIEAYYVKSDGTLDLYASYYPRVTYEFVRELASPPADAPPVGAGGSVSGKWYEPVEVELSQPFSGWSVKSGGNSYTYTNLGMDRETDSSPGVREDKFIAPSPACSFKQLWSTALEYDAEPEAVAIINYDLNGYDFTISDLGLYLEFDLSCRLRSQ